VLDDAAVADAHVVDAADEAGERYGRPVTTGFQPPYEALLATDVPFVWFVAVDSPQHRKVSPPGGFGGLWDEHWLAQAGGRAARVGAVDGRARTSPSGRRWRGR